MIITGDIASPSKIHSQQLSAIFDKYPVVFRSKTLVCNFEGLLNESLVNLNEPVLYNHPSVIKSLIERGPVIAALANNHILDFSSKFIESKRDLESSGIITTGAGVSKEEAGRPAVFYDGGFEVILFNACWDFLLYNHNNPTNGVFVNEISEEKLVAAVSKSKQEKPNATIVLFLHWNFDLEVLPFPMHRQFARALIDAGATLVVGTHSHCVQGGEKYGDGYIVYGLGNFFLPNGVFANGKLNFPSRADTELIIDYDFKRNEVICHWFEFKKNGSNYPLVYLSSEIFENSDLLRGFSPYQGMEENEYLRFFKKFRRKKFLIPVFKNFRENKLNALYTLGLRNRAQIARILAKIGLIKWQK